MIPLMALRSKRHQLFPCVFTTQAMLSTEKENLSQTLSLLEEELDTLEVGMETEFTDKKLEMVFQILKKDALNGTTLLLVPQTFYALRSAYFKAAVEDSKSPRTIMLQNIIAVFKLRALLLIDESHRNLDPLTQAILGVGDFIHLTQEESELLFQLMKPLLGLLPFNGADKKILRRIQTILQEKIEKAELQKLKELIASFYTSDREMIFYLTHKKAKEPSSLPPIGSIERYSFLLMRYFLNRLLKKVVKMKTDYDHLFSEEQGEIETPSFHKTPSHAQFKDHDLTAVLTIKGTWARGLNDDQLKTLLLRLQRQDHEEQSIAAVRALTPTGKRFRGWVEAIYPELRLRDIDVNNLSKHQLLLTYLKKHPDVKEYYLSSVVFGRIGYAEEEFTSTPAHLMDMGHCSVSFSATPLPRMAYPQALKEANYDPLFEARVIAGAARKKNQNFLFPANVDDFFLKLSQQSPEQSRRGRYMIDADGFLCHEANQEVAQRWLKASHLDGVIYFQEKKAGRSEDENLCLLLRGRRSVEFKGTDNLKEKLEEHEVAWDSLAIGIFYDSTHAESANFPGMPHTNIYILAGETLTIDHAVQSINRARGNLESAMDMTLIWVVPAQLLAKKKVKEERVTSAMLFSWFLQNKASSIKKVVLMAAFQEISLKIESLGLPVSPDKSQAIKKYERGFREKVKPQQIWDAQEELADTDKVLWRFAETCYRRFGYETPFEAVKKTLETFIAQVKAKIPQMVIDFQKTVLSEVHQRCVVIEEVHKLQFQIERPSRAPEPLRPFKLVTDKDYISSIKPENAAQIVFWAPRLTPGLFLEENQIHTARSLDISLKEKFLKPIDYMLIVLHEGKVFAEAVSDDVMVRHLAALKRAPQGADIKHKALILRADDVLYQRGTHQLNPSDEMVKQVLESEWLQDILIDVALLNGKILHNERFIKRVQKWPNFFEFWGRIVQAQPRPKEYTLEAILPYLPPKMQREVKDKKEGVQ